MMLYSCTMPRISTGLPLPISLCLSVSLSSPLSPCHPVLSFPFDPLLPSLHSAIHPQVQPLSLSLLLACRPLSPPAPPVRGCGGGGDLKEVEDVGGRAGGRGKKKKGRKKNPLSLSPPQPPPPILTLLALLTNRLQSGPGYRRFSGMFGLTSC